VTALKAAGPLDELVLLPLYPHYSYATTLSSMKEWRRVYGNAAGGPPERAMNPFTITRPTFKRWCKKLAFACGNFPIVREFICSSARMEFR